MYFFKSNEYFEGHATKQNIANNLLLLRLKLQKQLPFQRKNRRFATVVLNAKYKAISASNIQASNTSNQNIIGTQSI